VWTSNVTPHASVRRSRLPRRVRAPSSVAPQQKQQRGLNSSRNRKCRHRLAACGRCGGRLRPPSDSVVGNCRRCAARRSIAARPRTTDLAEYRRQVDAIAHRARRVPTRCRWTAAAVRRPPRWRDGWRHLRFLLLFSPRLMFLLPGADADALGLAAGAWLLRSRGRGGGTFDVHTLLYGRRAV